MRIAFDAKRAFRNNTGLGNYSRDVIRLFTHRLPHDEFFLFDTGGKETIDFNFNRENSKLITSPAGSGIGKAIWRQFAIPRQLQKNKIDVYHGLSNELPTGIEKLTTQSILTVHDLIFDLHPEWYPAIDRLIYRKKMARALKCANHVVAISQQTKADIVDLYKVDAEKIKVIYQGCNPIFSQKQSIEQLAENLKAFSLPENFVLYVGTIEPRKNLKTLVQAMLGLDIPLVFVGRPTNYFRQVHELMKPDEIGKKFIHIQNITMAQLAALYQKARLFVYPSLYEGFGIPIIEALHSGTPVITGYGALAEACGLGGVSVDVMNIDALRTEINHLWHDTEALDNLKKNGKTHIQQFNDEIIWSHWQALYSQLKN